MCCCVLHCKPGQLVLFDSSSTYRVQRMGLHQKSSQRRFGCRNYWRKNNDGIFVAVTIKVRCSSIANWFVRFCLRSPCGQSTSRWMGRHTTTTQRPSSQPGRNQMTLNLRQRYGTFLIIHGTLLSSTSGVPSSNYKTSESVQFIIRNVNVVCRIKLNKDIWGIKNAQPPAI